MRILYALNSGQPGGMEQHVLDLVNGMIGSEHEVFVWCHQGPVSEWYSTAGAKVTTHNIRLDIDPLYIFRLAKFLKEHKIDILHAHELKAAVNSLIAASVAKTPVRISHTHTPISEWQINELKKKFSVLLYSGIVNLLSDAEIALTESRRTVKIAEGIKESRIRVIPNGLDLSRFSRLEHEKQSYRNEILAKYSIPHDAYIFGNISRLTEEKGHETLIKAFSRLREFKEMQNNESHLIIGGGGRLENELLELAGSLGVNEQVTITGRFSEADKLKLYAVFDAFVFPSKAEGFGIVLLEAMASGLPAIVSNLEVLEEVGGSSVFAYFESGDHQNLAEKMLNLYLKRNSLQNITSSANERVRSHYSMDNFVDNYKKLYEDLNAGKN